jgi:hypothetical protein
MLVVSFVVLLIAAMLGVVAQKAWNSGQGQRS